MSSSSASRTRMPGAPEGRTREAASQGAPAASQLGLRFSENFRRHEDVARLRAAFRQAVEIAGGVEWLALECGKSLAYASKISEALHGVEGRHIQFEEWLPPLLSNWKAMDVLFAVLCDRTGRELPKAKRIATPEEAQRALVKKLREAGPAGAAILKAAAEDMGVDVEGLLR